MLNNCVHVFQVGWETLHDEFSKFVEEDKKSKFHDMIFDKLKVAVIDYSKSKHNWDSKAEDSLVICYTYTLQLL